MIRVEHLTKNYGPRVAVADVTFDVGKGEVLGFLGPNGAGKTTTMRILTGYLPPSGGRAEVAGFRRRHAVAPGARQHRLPARDRAAVSRHERPLLSRLHGQDQRRQRPPPRGRAGDGKSAHRAPRRRPDRQALQRLAAARRPRPGAARRSAGPDPRRADQRPRPEADHRNPQPDQVARRRAHRHPEHPHPARGVGDVLAHRHHLQRPRRRRGHARESRSTPQGRREHRR